MPFLFQLISNHGQSHQSTSEFSIVHNFNFQNYKDDYIDIIGFSANFVLKIEIITNRCIAHVMQFDILHSMEKLDKRFP